jgi:glutaminyl-peptide cyclotransferase
VIKNLLLAAAGLFLFPSCSQKEEATIAPSKAEPLAIEAVAEFSGDKAFAHVKALTDFGPRPPESDAYRQSLAYLESALLKTGWKTQRQSFKSVTPIGPVNFTNLLARYAPDSHPDWTTSADFVIGSHLDTKRYPDKIFVGANDSGSSTGVLVELARVLAGHGIAAQGIELVFFDGEEAILENIRGRDGLYGSKYYAGQLNNRSNKPRLAMVLDIVGDINHPLLIGGDTHSTLKAHTLSAANTLGISNWVSPYDGSIIDDHVPLMSRANLPVLHLIGDFNNMTYWHKDGDTLDKISPKALENTGKLTLQVLHQITKS